MGIGVPDSKDGVFWVSLERALGCHLKDGVFWVSLEVVDSFRDLAVPFHLLGLPI